MKFTRQHRREARLLWQAVTVNNVPDAERIREVIPAVQRQEGHDAEAVLRCFVQRLAVYIRSNQIRVVSADPLSPGQQAQLAGLAGGTESSGAGIRFSVDAAVLGGLRLERGYQVTDMTIARQLDVLQDMLLKN